MLYPFLSEGMFRRSADSEWLGVLTYPSQVLPRALMTCTAPIVASCSMLIRTSTVTGCLVAVWSNLSDTLNVAGASAWELN